MNSVIDFFDSIWRNGEIDLSTSKEMWDSRASEFKGHGNNGRVEQIISLLASREALDENSEVLDIGCGTGRYSVEFAKRSKKVTGIDISPRMIDFAKENAFKDSLTNTEFKVLPWEEADVEALGWKKKFDLAAAIMTPAISSRKCLDKLLYVSRKYCIMSGHLDRRERVIDEIEKIVLGRTASPVDYGKNIYCSFNVLWQYGIHPELSYYDMKRENLRNVDEAFNYYCIQLERKYKMSAEEKLEIKKYLNNIADEGQIRDSFESRTVWLFWKNR